MNDNQVSNSFTFCKSYYYSYGGGADFYFPLTLHLCSYVLIFQEDNIHIFTNRLVLSSKPFAVQGDGSVDTYKGHGIYRASSS